MNTYGCLATKKAEDIYRSKHETLDQGSATFSYLCRGQQKQINYDVDSKPDCYLT
jgi:hypothetical protein